MKPFFSNALLAALLAVGTANAATTTPVGYETLSVSSGINFLGVRLQSPVLTTGVVSEVTSTSVTASGTTFALSSGTTYVFEVKNSNGVTQEFLGSSASGSTITIPNLSSVVSVGDKFVVRAAPTLASVFGIANSAGLEASFYSFGGDIVMLPNPATPGGFDQYYYDDGQASWADVNGSPVDGSAIAWNYADGVVISATGGGLQSLILSGEVKTASTSYSLQGSSINFLSSVYPAQATLASSFGASNSAGLETSFYSFGGDVVYVTNASTPGGFDQYYYDDGQASWADINGSPIDATTVSLPSSVLIYKNSSSGSVTATAPSVYSTL